MHILIVCSSLLINFVNNTFCMSYRYFTEDPLHTYLM